MSESTTEKCSPRTVMHGGNPYEDDLDGPRTVFRPVPEPPVPLPPPAATETPSE